MKIFTSAQASTVLAIVIVCLVVSNVFLDRISRSVENTSIPECSTANQILTGNRCSNVRVTINHTGWPFIALLQYKFNGDGGINYQQVDDGIPLSREDSSSLSLNADLLIVLSLGVYIVYKRNQTKIDDLAPDLTDAVADTDGPIISSSDLLNEGGLTSMSKSTIGGFTYNIMANSDNRTMVFIALHGNAEIHVVAIGDQSKLSLPLTEKVQNKYLTPVSLEGDFPDYFHLYCSPDKQIELREILAPDIMAFLVDFCRVYDLEVFDDTMYVSQANIDRQNTEQDPLVSAVEDLIRHIGPTLDRLASPQPPDNQAPDTSTSAA